MFEAAGLGELIVRDLRLEDAAAAPDLATWAAMVERIKRPKPTIEIALVGKYIELPDAYLSVTEALRHAAWAHEVDAKVRWVDPRLTENVGERSRAPPASLSRRVRAPWDRAVGRPHARATASDLGLCLDPCAVIELARQVTGSRDVNSTEFDMFTEHPVIDFMPDQRDLEEKGGTMRLGLYPARLTPGSKAHAVYGDEVVYERHRHRFEVNNRYRATLEGAGMVLSGQSPDGRLVEIVELPDHPWFVASQFHPEFKSRPERPHPLFDGFVALRLRSRRSAEPVLAAARAGSA
jgi:CTP synthase